MVKKLVEPEKKILFDADVIIHFMKSGRIDILPKLFKNEICIPDMVKDELSRIKSTREYIDNFIRMYKIEIIDFPHDLEIMQEYTKLRDGLGRGKGESACMAIARFKNNYIASSNLKDIRDYCKTYNIKYYTTMDIIKIAFEKKLFDKNDIDNFIKKVKKKGSKLPVACFQEFLEYFS